jgi:2-methylisocitrate lyase-like PEP mutase family enzyme
MSVAARRATFRELHARSEIFVMPNAWDAGSARLLEACGFEALATTSSGFAWSLGREDQTVSLDELLAHVAALSASTGLPLSVDSERCYADTPAGVAETVRLLGAAGAAGCSIEDYDPQTDAIDDIGRAAERVAAAAEAAHEGEPMVLTARAEAHLYGDADLDETIARLIAYRDAGADVVYAPGLRDPAQIRAVVEAAGVPVNVLGLPGGPTVRELGELGVRRVSTGGALASIAYGSMLAGARQLLDDGSSAYQQPGLTRTDRAPFSA